MRRAEHCKYDVDNGNGVIAFRKGVLSMRQVSMLRIVCVVATIVVTNAQFAAAERPGDEFKLSLVAAQTTQPIAHAEDDWQVEVIPWLWLMGVDGTVSTRGVTKTLASNFFEVVEAADSVIGAAGRLNVVNGKWTGFIDGVYTEIGVDDITITGPDIRSDVNINIGPGPFDPDATINLGLLPTEVDFTLKIIAMDFGVAYRVVEWDMGESFDASRKAELDVFGGARYTKGTVEIDPARFAAVEEGNEWVDPFVGAKLLIPLAEQWDVQAWGDIGGFGVASDLTWSATGVVGFNFDLFDVQATLFGGYRALAYDYTGGSGPSDISWDFVLHGPLFGLRLTF
jgi:hypothetical protein